MAWPWHAAPSVHVNRVYLNTMQGYNDTMGYSSSRVAAHGDTRVRTRVLELVLEYGMSWYGGHVAIPILPVLEYGTLWYRYNKHAIQLTMAMVTQPRECHACAKQPSLALFKVCLAMPLVV